MKGGEKSGQLRNLGTQGTPVLFASCIPGLELEKSVTKHANGYREEKEPKQKSDFSLQRTRQWTA